jgi:hypothetical protein
MKLSKKVFLLIPLVIILYIGYISTRKDNDLVGRWIQMDYENGIATYTKNYFLDNQRPGIEFNRNGKLTIRQNGSWCGKHPIVYDDFEGYWKQTSDSIVVLNYQINKRGNKTGKIEEEWLILNPIDHQLKIKTLSYSNQQIKKYKKGK